MGTCYSCQARISKPTYPSDMSLTSDSSSKKGSHRLTSNAFTGQQEKSSRLRPPSSSSTSSPGVPKQTLRGSKSSSEKLNTSGESGIVLTVENTHNKYQRIHNANERKANERKAESNLSGPRRSKFGFASKQKPTATNGQRSDANRNLMDMSSDSLDSIDSKRSSSSVTGGGGDVGDGGSLRKKNLNRYGAYSPKGGGHWKMIDDSESTTTDTKSVSTHGRSEHDLVRDTNGNALTPTRVPQSKPQQESNKLTGNAGSRLKLKKPTSRLRPPQSTKAPQPQKSGRQWVKAGAVEMEEQPKASSVDRVKCPQEQQVVPQETTTDVKTKTRRTFFQRGKARLQFSHGSRYSANNEDNKQTHVTPDSGLGDTMVEEEISKTVGSMLDGGGDNKKDVKETINVLSKDIASVSANNLKSDDLATDGPSVDDIENKLSEQLAGQKLNLSNELLDDVDSYLDEAPRARLDSLESCSISSLNSDDLMLETDIMDDVYNQSSCSLDKTLLAGTTTTKTRTQPRSLSDALSMSQPASGLAKLDKRPVVRRLDGSGYWRQGSLKSASSVEGGSRERRLRTQSSTNEAVSELSNMMGAGASGAPPAIQRRPPKFSRERPASFPGPLSADGVVRPERTVQFRQRGKAPSISEEEHVFVDTTMYRTMIQELTDCKTMIFKLKRIIQQEEIGSPFGNHTFAGTLKNGYNKLSGSASTPGSPMVALDCNNSFAFVEPADVPNADIVQENAELRQQLQTMQQQLDEQDRTIKLLQQQMTKYECGHYGSEGKPCSNATTQTDKPRLAVPKNVLRPSATGGAQVGGAGGASSASGEPIISSRRFSNPKEDNDAAASGEKPARPKSQLPVGAGTMRGQRATGSRLPAMRIQRYSKGQPQLQSFSKIAQPQPAN